MANGNDYQLWKWIHMTDAGGKGMYRCTLCKTGKFHINAADGHFCGTRHRKALEAEFTNGGYTLVHKRDVFSRISELSLPTWRYQVQEPILKFLFDESLGSAAWPYSREDNRVALPASLVGKMEEKFDKFHKMEVTSLLELVAWKFNCLYLDGSGNFLTMQGILDQWAIDDSFDPVEYKRQRRLCSNVGVIVKRVFEFLW